MYSKLIPKSIFDESFGKENIGFCTGENYNRLYDLMDGTIFVPNSGNLKYIPIARRTRLNLIGVDNPRAEFAKILKGREDTVKGNISHGVKIGKNTIIHSCVVIEDDVVIGDNCTIGADGFGFIDDDRMKHLGGVIIREGVEIGNNTCIDRAVVGDTIIGENTKIDNLVHISHGVKIGKSCKIIAGVVVCGSVNIGNKVWIAPNSTIHQSLRIGDNAVIGMGSVVTKNVTKDTTVYGNPAS